MRARGGTLLVVLLAVLATAVGGLWAPRPVYAGPADRPTYSQHRAALPTGPVDGLRRALLDGDISPARYALERVRSLFRPALVRRRYGDVRTPAGREATLLLRDLALRVDALRPRDRRAARALLARPTDPIADPEGYGYRAAASHSFCSTHLCVHWVRTTGDAPPLADADADSRPDWVERTAREFERAWRIQVGRYGYRPPKDDDTSANHGPDQRLDVYLADTGADGGLYGTCTTDDPAFTPTAQFWDVSAYCVVDDDFAAGQFGGAPPLHSLRATAAHELFHAVQAAYDFAEDLWLMEGSAAWMEDEVYDGINDHHQYLSSSPLRRPHVPLDSVSMRYGAWLFWRFLSESLGTPRAPRPAVVREVWEHADASPAGNDLHSLQAVARVGARHGVAFRDLFAAFGRWNRAPLRYDEGRAYGRPAPLTRAHTLSRAVPGTGPRSVPVDHLATRHVGLRPAGSLRGRRLLRLTLDLPDRSRGSAATVTVHWRRGGRRVRSVPLDARGNGSVTVRFTRTAVAQVDLTLTNTSARYQCWQGTWLACQGRPVDDGLRFRYAARALR